MSVPINHIVLPEGWSIPAHFHLILNLHVFSLGHFTLQIM